MWLSVVDFDVELLFHFSFRADERQRLLLLRLEFGGRSADAGARLPLSSQLVNLGRHFVLDSVLVLAPVVQSGGCRANGPLVFFLLQRFDDLALLAGQLLLVRRRRRLPLGQAKLGRPVIRRRVAQERLQIGRWRDRIRQFLGI